MELYRPNAQATIIAFPLYDLENRIRTGATGLDSEWIAWTDSESPEANGNPGWADMAGEADEIAATGTYRLAVAAAEVPAASPYVMIRVQGTNIATQYVLINTSSVYANVIGWRGTQPNVLVSGRVDTSTGAMATDVITATAIAAGAIDASAIATDAIDADAIAANAIGASELATDAVNEIVDQVWDELIADHVADNSFGKGAQRLYFATPFTALTIGTVNTVGTAAISSGSFSGSAIDAAAMSVDVGSEFADAFLGRNVRGGSSTGRRVYESMAVLRNRVAISAGTMTVYGTNDTDTEFTADIATEARSAIVTSIDPA